MPNAAIENLRRNANLLGNTILQQRLQEAAEKRDLNTKIRAALVSGVAEGKMKPKAGVAAPDLLEADVPTILGAYEPKTDYSELKDQREAQVYDDLLRQNGGDRVKAQDALGRLGKIGPAEAIKTLQEMGFMGAGGNVLGGNLPPGSTAKVGPITVPLNREYSETEAKTASNAESIVDKIDQLMPLIGTEAENYFPFAVLGKKDGKLSFFDEGGQRFQSLKDDLNNNILNLKSGSAVSPNEAGRWGKMLPAMTRRSAVDKEQLGRLRSEYQAVEGRIKSGAQYDRKTGTFNGRAAGAGNGNQTQIPTFNTPEEVETAGLPDNTPVIVNGQRFLYRKAAA